MAALAQTSGPLTGDNFTDDQWITKFGYDAGITGDTDGTAYGLTLPPATDTVEIGSATIDSAAAVGGYGHGIPAGSTQSLEIPASTNPTIGRTDLIVLRYSTAFATDPGPVRLVRIAGTEGSAALPSHNTTQPTPVDMVLYAITRKQGQGLNQATVVDRRSRAGWHYLMPPGAPLPQTAPLGSTATRDGIAWRRDFDGSAVAWVQETWPTVVLEGNAATQGEFDTWTRQSQCEMTRTNDRREAHLVAKRTGTTVTANGNGGFEPDLRVMQLHVADRPVHDTPVACIVKSSAGGNTYHAGAFIGGSGSGDGWLTITSTGPNVPLGPAGPDDTVTVHAVWKVS
jgi:hypothetical protein